MHLKIFIRAFLFIIILTQSACLPLYYSRGSMGSETRYLAKPSATDTLGGKLFIEGSYTAIKGQNNGEAGPTYAAATVYYSKMFPNFYATLGAGMFNGQVKISRLTEYTGKQGFYGGNAFGEMAYARHVGKSSFFIGSRLSYQKESGDFVTMRNKLKVAGDDNIQNPNGSSFSFAVLAESRHTFNKVNFGVQSLLYYNIMDDVSKPGLGINLYAGKSRWLGTLNFNLINADTGFALGIIYRMNK